MKPNIGHDHRIERSEEQRAAARANGSLIGEHPTSSAKWPTPNGFNTAHGLPKP
jgi:hypothetical protein